MPPAASHVCSTPLPGQINVIHHFNLSKLITFILLKVYYIFTPFLFLSYTIKYSLLFESLLYLHPLCPHRIESIKNNVSHALHVFV